MAFWTVVWSRATNANSAATKTAVPMVNPTPARTSNHSVIVHLSYTVPGIASPLPATAARDPARHGAGRAPAGPRWRPAPATTWPCHKLPRQLVLPHTKHGAAAD